MTYILILAIALLGLTSCDKSETVDVNNEGRFKVKPLFLKGHFAYEIIEVDGVEYIATSRGGICPLVKHTTPEKTVFKINN